ncbi:hypothetical protein E3P99_03811 [Wallemia hederae]|uniref:Uncharacterized protein n=1 Tax=Wallemia hederae TaxID=1540922 RepID=A0A4T0FFG7_9BASI|nr:hypothetical protein E3P99_03811 [Wallemia hederae]
MLRTLVRGAGRGSTKPLVIGDETIDLRAFRNTPAKGFVPDRSSLQGESALSNKLRNRTSQRPQKKQQEQQEAGQFDDADHQELLRTLGDRRPENKAAGKPQSQTQRRGSNHKQRNEEQGKDVQRRAAKQHSQQDKPAVDLQTTQSKKDTRKPKLKEIEIDRMDLSALVFDNQPADLLPTLNSSAYATEISEEERRKLHMEAVGGEYDRYASHATAPQKAMSVQKMISLAQRQEIMDNINRITKGA